MRVNRCLLLTISLLLLSSCNENLYSDPNNSVDTATSTIKESKIEFEDTSEYVSLVEEYSQPIDTALGSLTPVYVGYSEDLGIDGTDNPSIPYKYSGDYYADNIEIFVSEINLYDLELSDEGVTFFNDSGPKKVVTFQVLVVNESRTEAIYDTSLMKIRVNNKEIFPEPSLVEAISSLDYPLDPGEKREGFVGFVIMNGDFPKKLEIDFSQFFVSTPAGKEKLIPIELVDIKESVLRDLQ